MLLQDEYQAVLAEIKEEIKQAGDGITISVDGWTDIGKRSLYAVTVVFPDRTLCLLSTEDLSGEKHTAANLEGECKA